MSNSKFVKISRLITAYNLQIDNEVLSDDLKCVKCKLVLQDACVVPCGCSFCRVCIDDLMASGSEFCPGVSEDCEESNLSEFTNDFRANKNVCKLVVRCPQNQCLHKCQLDELEEHMRVCGRKSVACPFHELGCQEDKLTIEEMSGHFQEENRSHGEILIGMIADINREMESHKREIEILKRSDESRKDEIERLKGELELKDGQMRTINDQMEHLENENKSMKDGIKLIKQEKADLADRVRILSENIEREIGERDESDERDMVNVIEHVDGEITAITVMIGSNKNELDTAIRSVRDDIRSINEDGIESIKDDIKWIKSQLQLIQAPAVELGQIDASFEWTIDEDLKKVAWSGSTRRSKYFTGVGYPYNYQLKPVNDTIDWELRIFFCILPGASNALLPWPFSGKVTVTVADRSKSDACMSITLQCNIARPADEHGMSDSIFRFSHTSLIEAGVDLTRGVRVSCGVVPSSACRRHR